MPTMDGFLEAHDGLHAKTFVIDTGNGQSTTVTGSANLTSPTWGTNVEFDAVLHGPTADCGVEAVLNGSPEAPGLSRIMEEYTVTDEAGADDATIATSYELERFHQQLAVARTCTSCRFSRRRPRRGDADPHHPGGSTGRHAGLDCLVAC